jgi:hypothetical protein
MEIPRLLRINNSGAKQLQITHMQIQRPNIMKQEQIFNGQQPLLVQIKIQQLKFFLAIMPTQHQEK